MIGLIFLILLIFSFVFFLIWLWFFKEDREPSVNYYKLALKAYEVGDYRRANELFLKMPNLNTNMDAKYKLGLTYAKLKKYEEAKECFEAVLKKNPKKTDVMENLAKVLEKQGLHDDAIAIFTKLSSKASNDSQNIINISNVYMSKGDYSKALEILEGAKKKFSDDTKLLLAITKCKSKMIDIDNEEECKQILSEYEKLANRKDLPDEIYIELAKSYAINGEVDKAIENCQKAISCLPEEMEAYQLLGLIQLITNDYDKAKSNLTIALNFQPNNRETHDIFSYLFCKQVDDCPLNECRDKYYKLVKKYLK